MEPDAAEPEPTTTTTPASEADGEAHVHAVRYGKPIAKLYEHHKSPGAVVKATQDCGPHGTWSDCGVHGWFPNMTQNCLQRHAQEVNHSPWLAITRPPGIEETIHGFHEWVALHRKAARQLWLQTVDEAAQTMERVADEALQAQMRARDERPLNAGPGELDEDKREVLKSSRHLANLAETYEVGPDNNADLQRSDPTLYGPYLKEGERYQTPRTEANVRAAVVKSFPQYEDDSTSAELKEFWYGIVYRHWILFDDKLRAVHGVLLDLDLEGEKPIRMQPFKWSPKKMIEGKKLLDQFLEEGIIGRINSEWAFPALIVPKPGGKGWRLVVDLRRLNLLIPHDTYEPPTCDTCIEWLADKPFRTLGDMRWGFHQLELSERMRQYITFVTPFGTYCYNRLVMGYINSTAEFQRQMNMTMKDALLRCAMVMVDDLIIASPSLEQHMKDVRYVFGLCAARGHSLKAEKVKFLQPEVEYLGHVCTKDQLHITERHRQAILDMPAPVNRDGSLDLTGLRSFIGLVKFCRRHVKDCARLCAFLNELTSDNSEKIWTSHHQLCMDQLKHAIAYSKGLYHIDYSKPIFVCTDGSKRGIGGYLYQKVGGEERPISYFSRQTTKDEAKWDTKELELLAIMCTLEHYHHLIDGQKLILQTDHRNLRWLCNIKEPQGRLGRWVLRLSEYNFELDYRAGKHNEVADALSRLPIDAKQATSELNETNAEQPEWMRQLKTPEQSQATALLTQLGTWGAASVCELTIAATAQAGDGNSDDCDSDSDGEDDDPLAFKVPQGQEVDKVTPSELAKEQRKDEQAQRIIEWVKQCEQSSAPDKKERECLQNWEIGDEGLLYKLTEASYDGASDTLRPFVPKALRIKVMRQHHTGLFGAHRGQRATLHSIAQRFYWPRMAEDVREFVSVCRGCQLGKGTNPAHAGLLKGKTYSQALHTICMDLVGPIRQDSGGGTSDLYIFVMVDPFTHFLWLEVIESKAAEQVFKAFVTRILLEEGAPRVIHVDNGSEFKNRLMSELFDKLQVRCQYSPAYHPQSNQTERANRFVVETLRVLVNEPRARKRDWHRLIKYIEFAYRRMPIPGTNISAYMMARGREPMLPDDIAFMEKDLPNRDWKEYLRELQQNMEVSRRLVAEARQLVQMRNSDLRDLSQKEERFAVGDVVRYWNLPRTTNGDPKKLKFRNKLFKVAKVHDEHTERPCRYDLRSVEGDEFRENASAGQLARFRGDNMLLHDDAVMPTAQDAGTAAGAAPRATAGARAPAFKMRDQAQLWAKLQLNRHCCFVFKNEPPSFLRVGEVVNNSPDGRLITVHFWIHSLGYGQGGGYKPELPLANRKLAPEYKNSAGRSVFTFTDESKVYPVEMDLDTDDIDVILPTLTLTVSGKVKDDDLRKVDGWLLERGKAQPRAYKALSDPRLAPSKTRIMTAGFPERGNDGQTCGNRSTFMTPHGPYCYDRLAMGLPDAPADFQRQMKGFLGSTAEFQQEGDGQTRGSRVKVMLQHVMLLLNSVRVAVHQVMLLLAGALCQAPKRARELLAASSIFANMVLRENLTTPPELRPVTAPSPPRARPPPVQAWYTEGEKLLLEVFDQLESHGEQTCEACNAMGVRCGRMPQRTTSGGLGSICCCACPPSGTENHTDRCNAVLIAKRLLSEMRNHRATLARAVQAEMAWEHARNPDAAWSSLVTLARLREGNEIPDIADTGLYMSLAAAAQKWHNHWQEGVTLERYRQLAQLADSDAQAAAMLQNGAEEYRERELAEHAHHLVTENRWFHTRMLWLADVMSELLETQPRVEEEQRPALEHQRPMREALEHQRLMREVEQEWFMRALEASFKAKAEKQICTESLNSLSSEGRRLVVDYRQINSDATLDAGSEEHAGTPRTSPTQSQHPMRTPPRRRMMNGDTKEAVPPSLKEQRHSRRRDRRSHAPIPPNSLGREPICVGTDACTDAEWFDCHTATVDECADTHDCCAVVRQSARLEEARQRPPADSREAYRSARANASPSGAASS